MSPKLSKFQNFKKEFKDALLKYIVVKCHNFYKLHDLLTIQCQIENGGVGNLFKCTRIALVGERVRVKHDNWHWHL